MKTLAFCTITLCLTPQLFLAQTASEAVAKPAQPGAEPYAAMTQKERLSYYIQHMFSPESVVRSAAAAGFDQATNTPSEWGQGAVGYGRRFASSYGEHIVESTVMYGASAVLHEDNRYFRCPQSGFGPRIKYALLSSVMGRHDDGSRHVSFSRIGSYVAAAFISRTWQPPSTSGPGSAAGSFAFELGTDAGFNVAREFLPSIFHSHAPVETVSVR